MFCNTLTKLDLRSRRTRQIVEWFGLQMGGKRVVNGGQIDLPELHSGMIALVAGPSGAGKTCFLRRLARKYRCTSRWIDLAQIPLPDRPVVDCFANRPLEQTLLLLSRVGLGEVWTYLKRPRQLSDGQKWRLRLALALAQAGSARSLRLSILAADEFAAVLDRVTAAIVARALRKTIDAIPSLCAVVATSHEDLIEALNPDLVLKCDFGRVEVTGAERQASRNFLMPGG
jgi:hypothetical protein